MRGRCIINPSERRRWAAGGGVHRLAGGVHALAGGVHGAAGSGAHRAAGGVHGVDSGQRRLGLFVSSGPVTPRLGT